jgi:mRNA-degrading endonuclease YafQ of YafQ-DinJ toxin-antitoxin module
MIEFEEIAPFKKDFKSLLKRYKTLDEDLETVKKVLEILPEDRPPFSYRIDNLGIENCVVKVKKIACKSLKGKGVNSGLRLVYAYFKEENRIVFMEIYHKNDKENEDRDRILEYFK